MRIRCAAFAILSLLTFAAAIQADVAEADFGNARDGTQVQLFTITNASGVSVRIMTYGAAVVSLKVPDRAGKLDDIVLGYDTIDGYLENDPFFGAIVGRCANRIRGAAFTLDGVQYKLRVNDHGNTLHGGRAGLTRSYGPVPRSMIGPSNSLITARTGRKDFPAISPPVCVIP